LENSNDNRGKMKIKKKRIPLREKHENTTEEDRNGTIKIDDKVNKSRAADF
jgi:hypothetical protein